VAAPTVMAAVVDLMNSRRSMGMMGVLVGLGVCLDSASNLALLERGGGWEVGGIEPSDWGKPAPSET
jgi:hypothetical protein